MTGNVLDAEAALLCDLPLLSDEGTARVAYLKDNVVYKVDVEFGANEAEWFNYLRLRNLSMPPNIRIPNMSRFVIGDETVLALQYINGVQTGECMAGWSGLPCDCASPCLTGDIRSTIYDLGITDLAWGNVLAYEGRYYIVDLEC